MLKTLLICLALAGGLLAGNGEAAPASGERRCDTGWLATWYQPEDQRRRRLRSCTQVASENDAGANPLLQPGQRYHGIWDDDRSAWAVPPQHEHVRYFNDEVVYVRAPGQRSWQLLNPRPGQVQTVHRWHFPYWGPRGGRTSDLMAFTDAEHTRAVMFDRQARSGPEITGIDPGPLNNADGFVIDPLYAGTRVGGVIVRHRQAGEHYYQAYDSEARPLGGRHPVAETWLAVMAHLEPGTGSKPAETRDQYVLVHQRSDGSLWPLLMADNQLATPHANSRGFDGYLLQRGTDKTPPRLQLAYQKFERNGEVRWASFRNTQKQGAMSLTPAGIAAVQEGTVLAWSIVEADDIPQGGVAFIESVAPGEHRVHAAQRQRFAGALGATVYASEAEARAALATAQASLVQERQRYAAELQRRLENQRANQQAAASRQSELYDTIHSLGPNPASLSRYGIETETYCAMRGPRCEEFRRHYQQWQDAHNRGVASANQARLQKLYNQGVDQAAVRASAECFRRAADSKRAAVSGRQDWHYSSEGCKPRR